MATPKDMRKGAKYQTNNYGDLVVCEYINSLNVLVEFTLTKYKTVCQTVCVRMGKVRDPFYPSVFGVGFFGVGKYNLSEHGKGTKCQQIWRGMIERCYYAKYHEDHPTYKGCSVDPRWHNYQVFAEWFEVHYIKGFHLDKDKLISGNRIYSPEACCFISPQENTEISVSKHYKFKSPVGEIVEVFNLNKFCRELNLNTGNMHKVHAGDRRTCKGWEAV